VLFHSPTLCGSTSTPDARIYVSHLPNVLYRHVHSYSQASAREATGSQEPSRAHMSRYQSQVAARCDRLLTSDLSSKRSRGEQIDGAWWLPSANASSWAAARLSVKKGRMCKRGESGEAVAVLDWRESRNVTTTKCDEELLMRHRRSGRYSRQGLRSATSATAIEKQLQNASSARSVFMKLSTRSSSRCKSMATMQAQQENQLHSRLAIVSRDTCPLIRNLRNYLLITNTQSL
jgi:hypothetical protein